MSPSHNKHTLHKLPKAANEAAQGRTFPTTNCGFRHKLHLRTFASPDLNSVRET